MSLTALPALYDLSPLGRILMLATTLALAPLAWVWYRHRKGSALRRLQALTLLTTFLTLDLIMFGAFTRLTDSGLGCPDWPGCYGQTSPIGAHTAIAAAHSAMPAGPVSPGKAWIEMLHRYLATGIGALILLLAALIWIDWLRRDQRPRLSTIHPIWPTLTLLWVCVQGAFGALTVTMKLFPAIVTLHLLGGMVLLALLCVQFLKLYEPPGAVQRAAPGTASRRLALAAVTLLLTQIALGGWVSANYAVLACPDLPKCQNSWWPRMDFAQGFELWRGLGLTSAGVPLDFSALTAIHYVHRLMAVVVLVALGWLALRLNSVPALRVQSRWLAALTALQLVTGLSNVVLGWPLPGAVLHTGAAAGLVGVMTWVLLTLATPLGEI